MAKKNLKIDDLAVMINRGFSDVHKRLDHTATKQELQDMRKEMATQQELQELRKDMTEALRIIADDVHDLKVAMGPLVRVVAALETDVRNLNMRVNRLERRSGLAK